MKKNILFVLAAAVTIFSCSKKIAVPDVVKTKFASLYPDAKNVKWEKEDAMFEAIFKVNDAETSLVFDASGTLTETETVIPVSSLPAPIADYIAKNAGGKKIDEACKIVDAAGKVTYEAEAGDADYIFDESGGCISKKEEEDKD